MSPRPLSPILLLGAGAGEATCGILYLASYLRRHDLEAYVRLYDGDETDDEVRRSLEALIARVRPKLVGISLKWFHHVQRALLIARLLRELDPEIRVVVGGNSASYWWRELEEFDSIDFVALGDGERPLLAIARGEESPPNCVIRDRSGVPRRLPLQYIQGATNTEDIYYSHFDQLFLSQQDLHAYSGWVAPGKGCGENCLYCGGARGNQKAGFGRAKPFLRSEESVRRDHAEVVNKTWQFRYDFSGSTAEFLQGTWAGVNLSHHACTYFLWGVPKLGLIDALAGAFEKVFMVLDIGCFSESQRHQLMKLGLLKQCASNAELLKIISECRRHPNLDIEVSGIAGLPYATEATLAEELELVRRVIDLDCVVGSQRLESQPGALVTEHPARFEMISEARTFKEFVDYFEAREPGDNSVPMLRFIDAKVEAAVQRTSDRVDELAWAHRDQKQHVPLSGKTRLRSTARYKRDFPLGDWLGPHRVPARFSKEPVTVVRSVNGTQIICAPSLSPRKFSDPTLAQGEDGAILLQALDAFDRPLTVANAVGALKTKARLDPGTAHEVIDHLVAGRFLQPA